MSFFWTLVALVAVLALCWRFLGSYLAAVYEGRVTWLSWLERPIYRMLGTHPESEQEWTGYAGSLIVFSGLSLLLAYVILRLQGHLGDNPLRLGGVTPALSFNTAVSFVSNTSWQAYAGESTLTYVSQMAPSWSPSSPAQPSELPSPWRSSAAWPDQAPTRSGTSGSTSYAAASTSSYPSPSWPA